MLHSHRIPWWAVRTCELHDVVVGGGEEGGDVGIGGLMLNLELVVPSSFCQRDP
jgi:hypothetical protein